MTYRQHILAGIGFGSYFTIAIQFIFRPWKDIEDLIGNLIPLILGSLIPDIDHPKSYLSWKIPGLILLIGLIIFFGTSYMVLGIITIILGIAFYFIPDILNRKYGHRGIIHAPFIYIVSLLPLILTCFAISNPISGFWFSYLFIGIMSHLFVDGYTEMGIPLFAPFLHFKYNTAFAGSFSWIITWVLSFVGIYLLMTLAIW
jgi:inner membrane protein